MSCYRRKTEQLLEDLIRDGNEKGIDQYVRLSNLSGTTGAATKLGLTGLPLATAKSPYFLLGSCHIWN